MANYSFIFIVGSVIYPQRHQAFSPDERYEQLLQCLSTIRQKVPDCFILLVEGSPQLTEGQIATLSQSADKVLYSTDEQRHYIDHPTNIGCGEHKQLEDAITFILESNVRAPLVFKLSGRYFLNDNFNVQQWNRNTYSFKVLDDSSEGKVYCTGMYSIPFALLKDFKDVLVCSQSIATKGTMVEKALWILINKENVEYKTTLGFSGWLSYNRTFKSE